MPSRAVTRCGSVLPLIWWLPSICCSSALSWAAFFAAWRWPGIVWAHLPAVAYAALVEFVGFTCPLTPVENYLRRRAGEAGYRGGFIAHYLVKAIYPPGLTRGMQTGVGVLVLLIAITGYWGLLRRMQEVSPGHGTREPAPAAAFAGSRRA